MKASLADSVSCRRVKKTLDGVGRGIVDSRTKVDRAINDPVTAITQNAYEFEGAIVDESADCGGARKGTGRHIALHRPPRDVFREEGERDKAFRREEKRVKESGE
jgi:hypothetical protein